MVVLRFFTVSFTVKKTGSWAANNKSKNNGYKSLVYATWLLFLINDLDGYQFILLRENNISMTTKTLQRSPVLH
jgi:hypothetical protein